MSGWLKGAKQFDDQFDRLLPTKKQPELKGPADGSGLEKKYDDLKPKSNPEVDKIKSLLDRDNLSEALEALKKLLAGKDKVEEKVEAPKAEQSGKGGPDLSMPEKKPVVPVQKLEAPKEASFHIDSITCGFCGKTAQVGLDSGMFKIAKSYQEIAKVLESALHNLKPAKSGERGGAAMGMMSMAYDEIQGLLDDLLLEELEKPISE